MAAVVLQVAALGLAPVSVVQPMLAGGLVVALAVRSVRDSRFPSTNDLLGAALAAGVAMGVAAVLISAALNTFGRGGVVAALRSP